MFKVNLQFILIVLLIIFVCSRMSVRLGGLFEGMCGGSRSGCGCGTPERYCGNAGSGCGSGSGSGNIQGGWYGQYNNSYTSPFFQPLGVGDC